MARAPALAERFTVIVPDQRGMGASTVTDGNYTKTALAGDLAQVLDALGHEQAHVVGYDLGAGVAVAFARDRPHRILEDAADNAPLRKEPLAMPALAMGGDSHAGPMLERFWSDVAKDLSTVIIPGAGHWLGDENPLATANALADFFSQA